MTEAQQHNETEINEIVRPPVKSVKQVRAFFEASDKAVLTFAGYSGAGYEDEAELERIAKSVLSEYDPATTIVNIGVTPDGIGIVYQWAKEMGFQTTGIVSSCALDYQAQASKHVDHAFFVVDSSWGGFLDGTRDLSPTSEAMVSVSREIVAIGGGEVSRDELFGMKQRGKRFRFFPAEMNRAKAIAKAKKNDRPAPSDFWGAAHAVFAEPALSN